MVTVYIVYISIKNEKTDVVGFLFCNIRFLELVDLDFLQYNSLQYVPYELSAFLAA